MRDGVCEETVGVSHTADSAVSISAPHRTHCLVMDVDINACVPVPA